MSRKVEPLTTEPGNLKSGDSVSWTRTLPDFPASEWTLTYYIAGPKTLTVIASADGDGFLATITAAQSSTLTAGNYWIEGRVTKGDEASTVIPAQLLVVSDSIASAQEGYDGRSHARKCRDALRQMMEDTSGNPVVDYTIFGERNVRTMPVAERLQLLGYYEGLVAQEERALAAKQGKRSGVFIRFRNPT